MLRNLLIISVLLFASCIQNTNNSTLPANYIEGKVVSVGDGDSFVVLINNERTRVRLYGVDSPERRQAFGTKARNFTNERIYNKTIRLDIKDKDKYKRLVAVVYYGNNNNNLNEELLENGFAWHYKYYDSSKKWSDLENEARTQKKGLWADKKPIEPWDYRRTESKRK